MGRKGHRPDNRQVQQPAGLQPGWRAVRPLTYVPQSGRGFELARALVEAHEAGRLSDDAHAKIGERNIWLDTKRGALRIVYSRVRQGWLPLRERAQRADPQHDLYTLPLEAADLPLAVDVASYVMLLDATLDTAVSLATCVERAVVPAAERTPKATLRALPGVNPDEQRNVLGTVRDAFAHDVAPWLSAILMRDPNAEPDLAILTADRQDFETGTGYVLLSQVFQWAGALDEHLLQLERILAARLYAAASRAGPRR